MCYRKFTAMAVFALIISACGSTETVPDGTSVPSCNPACDSGHTCSNGQCVANNNPDGGTGVSPNLCDGLLHMKPDTATIVKCFDQLKFDKLVAQLSLGAGEWGECPNENGSVSGSFVIDDHTVTGTYFGGFTNCVSRDFHSLVGPSASSGAYGGQLPTYPGDGTLVNGAMCGSNADCHSGNCNHICMANGQSSGNANGATCSSPSECASGNCVSGVCQASGGTIGLPASCNDGVMNGDETCIDGGGSCNALNKCALGKGCKVTADCVAGTCFASTHTCQADNQPTPSGFTQFSETCSVNVHLECFAAGHLTRSADVPMNQEFSSNPSANEDTCLVQNLDWHQCSCKWLKNGVSMSGPSSSVATANAAQCFWNGPPAP